MTDQERTPTEDSRQGLQQAFLRLTSPRYEELQAQIDSLQKSLENLNTQLVGRDEQLDLQDQDLETLIQETRGKLDQLESSLSELDRGLHSEISQQTNQIGQQLSRIQADLVDPGHVAQRFEPVFFPVLNESVKKEQDEFARAVSPVIGPAIRHQIRESRQDIIDSLYPIIGQIISKAIAESIRELTRNIDRRMRRQLDLHSQFRRLAGRLRGVSDAEIMLRDSLPYNLQHIFLIHRPTGILLQHLSSHDEEVEDADIVSGMLTAIRDFVSDSFGSSAGELEEITHGDRRFLIESGMYAYIAVVVEGIEPSGYYALIGQTTSEINLKYEPVLKSFSGELDELPNFSQDLTPLLAPEQALLEESALEPMSRTQKWTIAGILAGILLLLGLVIFACYFSVRLWPIAFPSATTIPILTQTVALILTTRASPTPSNTAALTPNPTHTSIFTPTPTVFPTSTIQPSHTTTIQPTPTLQIVNVTGNIYLRSGPSIQSPSLRVIAADEQVILLEQQGLWLHVQLYIEGEGSLDGWVWSRYVSLTPVP